MAKNTIKNILAREILDSRGNPTIEVSVVLNSGIKGVASVPSGASTGSHEAIELRDGDKKRYFGKGVLKAVVNVNNEINSLLKGIEVTKQQDIDRLMIRLDGTKNKSVLGANAILGVSLAAARAASIATGLPLYKYLRMVYKIPLNDYRMPRPMMNILNGGAHANWCLDVQEFMIVPNAKTIKENVRIGSQIFHTLGSILKKKSLSTNKGDEGGYAVSLKKNEEAFVFIQKAIKDAGFKQLKDVDLAIDAAASEWFDGKFYTLKKPSKKMKSEDVLKMMIAWQKKYNLLSIEDGLAEDDWTTWVELTKKLDKKTMLVGDDLFVTNIDRLEKGIVSGVANSILIKPNQIGSLTETIAAISMAKSSGYKVIISHRSGETVDTFIADLSVAVGADFIKTGSLSRSERVEKYNRLMDIEGEVIS